MAELHTGEMTLMLADTKDQRVWSDGVIRTMGWRRLFGLKYLGVMTESFAGVRAGYRARKSWTAELQTASSQP